MGYIKLEREKVKAKIFKDYTKAFKKFELRSATDPHINHLEAIIYCVEQNPKTTGIEFARGIYRVLYHEARYKWAIDVNEINTSDYFLDEHIIGVDEIITNVATGKKHLVTYKELAKGQNAIDRAATFDAHIQGFKDKQNDLLQKGHDKALVARLNRKKKIREQIVG